MITLFSCSWKGDSVRQVSLLRVLSRKLELLPLCKNWKNVFLEAWEPFPKSQGLAKFRKFESFWHITCVMKKTIIGGLKRFCNKKSCSELSYQNNCSTLSMFQNVTSYLLNMSYIFDWNMLYETSISFD